MTTINRKPKNLFIRLKRKDNETHVNLTNEKNEN